MQRGLLFGSLALMAGGAQAGGFINALYSADITLQDSIDPILMGIAFDGTHYWTASGGLTTGTRLAQYDDMGNAIASFTDINMDFRSITTDASGTLIARRYAQYTLEEQGSPPGSFTQGVTLSGGYVGDQATVVLNRSGQYVSMLYGMVYTWDASGSLTSSFRLDGFYGATNPALMRVAVMGDYILTLANQTLSAWDYSGTLVGETSLQDAGIGETADWSLSYTNDHVFVADATGLWRGYQVELQTATVPEPSALGGTLLGLLCLPYVYRRRRGDRVRAERG